MPIKTVKRISLLTWLALAFAISPALAEKKYGPGVTDAEITIGQTMPNSGPLSAFSTMGKAQLAYFKMINEQGGVNGRKIVLLSLDDGYSPPRTVEQTRRLVESENVLLMFSSFGTPTALSVIKYLNAKKVPQLFIAATGMKWGDPRVYPWTMAFFPNQKTGTAGFVQYLLTNKPNAKIALLHPNDDFGKDYAKALKELLGANASKLIVAEVSYETSDPTADSQVVTLKGSGADVFFNFSTPRFAAQAIRKAHDIGWKPLQFIPYTSTSVTAVLQPAGFEKSIGIVSAAYLKDPTDPQWKNDRASNEWIAWMKKYYPDGNLAEIYNVYGYTSAQMLVHLLKKCGDDLTRENVMREASHLKDVSLPMLLPGITINTSADDFDPLRQMRLMQFNGKQWVLFGEVIGR